MPATAISDKFGTCVRQNITLVLFK